jgi:hypothetical protein
MEAIELWVLSLLGFVGKLVCLSFCCLLSRTIAVVEALLMDLVMVGKC